MTRPGVVGEMELVVLGAVCAAIGLLGHMKNTVNPYRFQTAKWPLYFFAAAVFFWAMALAT